MSRYINKDKVLGVLTDCGLGLIPIVTARCIIDNMPTEADDKLISGGKWIPIVKGEPGYSAGDFRCSVCGKPNKAYCLTPYCCNCGSIMEGKYYER